uniref:Uncharacterized protein n=1 Tax=Candidatus Kentrum eta TaxID=2126337 RepID=A0A450VB35_9GAMM|nr:MAG: hypothetical protein BECKH772A_GA0070896_100827 [Candidatus Kentron sp. H]VFJ95829.1 MAG: hypothetical protein BECKH772B_GA0070898_100827 [Candidatus Kentron sp. H]VFK02006.1 MAG: hypothetical protein BECKH772C_GA0070978_100797 [Candidatus Kentron sp. H]
MTNLSTASFHTPIDPLGAIGRVPKSVVEVPSFAVDTRNPIVGYWNPDSGTS